MEIKNAYMAKTTNGGFNCLALETRNHKLVKLFNNSRKRKDDSSKLFKDIIDYIKERIDDKYQLLAFFRKVIKNDIVKMSYRCITDTDNDKICYSYATEGANIPFAIRGYDREIRKFIRTILNESNTVIKDEYGNIIERSHLNTILRDSDMSQSEMYHYLLKGLKLSGNKHTRFPEIFMPNWRCDELKPNGGVIDLRGIK